MTLLLRYWKVAGLILVALAVAWHWLADLRVEKQLEEARVELAAEKAKVLGLEAELVKVTVAVREMEVAKAEADQARLKVQADLVKTQQRLRAAQVPKECPAAVDWLIEERTR